MAAGPTYTSIASNTLTSTAASVTFSSISGTYTDLILAASHGSSSASNTYIRFNGATSAYYSLTQLVGTGTASMSSRESNLTAFRIDNYAAAFTAIENSYIIQIQNYSNTTTYKSVLARCNATQQGLEATVGLWRGSTGSSTEAITSVTYYPGGGSWLVGSYFALYGIKAA